MKSLILFFCLFCLTGVSLANLKDPPLRFTLRCDKPAYYEGEKITMYVTITNRDTLNAHPVILPHTQGSGKKLFLLNVYDKASNTRILRYSEDSVLHVLVKEPGSVSVKYLKPLETIEIPLYLNDMEMNYNTQVASHHRFAVPLFAGIYRLNLCYFPKGQPAGDSLYTYYREGDRTLPVTSKRLMPENGLLSNTMELRIKRRADTVVTLDGKTYYIKTDKHRYYYMSEPMPQIVTDLRCHHITNLPADSCSVKDEYFYSHFTDVYAEYISRFEDGDIREYRNFFDDCPDYLYTEQYNHLKQKTLYALQLPDKRFYRVTYQQPGDKVLVESYCNEKGTNCTVTTYVYDTNGALKNKKVTVEQPCEEFELDGKIRRGHRASNLDGK